MRDDVATADRDRAVRAAQATSPFDLLLVGGTVVDVGTGRLRRADVGVVGPLIASVHPPGAREDAEVVADCTGSFLAPGLVDLHVHFESSMLTPAAYAAAVAPRGTTTVFCDPHELANVAGVDGVRYAVDASRGLPVRFIVQAPSCVPPQPGLERSAHDLLEHDIAEMLSWSEVGGLAEVMDMLGVLHGDDRMRRIVATGLSSGKLISGHAAGLGDAGIAAYLAAGIDSDHELFAEGDLMARLDAGMTVELRGMLDALLPAYVRELAELPELPVHLVLCTDDLFAETLLSVGGLDHLLRRLIAYGMDPVRAIRLATYHAAYRLGRNDLGMVAAGRVADLLVLDDLAAFTVRDVYAAGARIASRGTLLVEAANGPARPPLDTVRLHAVTPDDYTLAAGRTLPEDVRGARSLRLRCIEGIIGTTWAEVEVALVDGVAVLPPGYLLQAVTHRHGRATAETKLAVIAGWGDAWTGAIATTVSHDTHNLVVFGRDPVDMAVAANAVIASGGGVAVAEAGSVTALLPLPIAGILSDRSAAEVAAAQRHLLSEARRIGLPQGQLTQPLMQVMASSLACLPGPHLTDLGLIDGTTGELLSDPVLAMA